MEFVDLERYCFIRHTKITGLKSNEIDEYSRFS